MTALEEHEAALVKWLEDEVRAIERDAPGLQRKVAHESAHQRRLAGAVAAHETDHVAFADVERQAAQHLHGVDGDAQTFHDEQGAHAAAIGDPVT